MRTILPLLADMGYEYLGVRPGELSLLKMEATIRRRPTETWTVWLPSSGWPSLRREKCVNGLVKCPWQLILKLEEAC
jgi:hypothetical protein